MRKKELTVDNKVQTQHLYNYCLVKKVSGTLTKASNALPSRFIFCVRACNSVCVRAYLRVMCIACARACNSVMFVYM